MPGEMRFMTLAAELTPAQQEVVAQINDVALVGTVSAGLIIFLLAVIAVRGLASW